jgi:hypothetical protein
MNKKKLISNISHILFLSILGCGISSDGKEASSNSIKNSKKQNLWQATYLPNKKDIILTHDTFIIKEIWVEKRWLYRSNEKPETFRDKYGRDMYNIYLSFDKDAFSAFHKDGKITPFGGSLGDNGDKHRSAAASIRIGDFSTGFNIFTSNREWKKEGQVTYEKGILNRLFKKTPTGFDGGFGANLPYGPALETGHKYRFAPAFFKYKGFKVGVESYRYIGHPIQNIGAHHLALPQRGFPSLDNNINPYFQYQTTNPFTLW